MIKIKSSIKAWRFRAKVKAQSFESLKLFFTVRTGWTADNRVSY